MHFHWYKVEDIINRAGRDLVIESITLPKRLYHIFWAENGKGPLIAGEVSKVNDDKSDNCFLEKAGRFTVIEEDCQPVHSGLDSDVIVKQVILLMRNMITYLSHLKFLYIKSFSV